MRFPDVRVRITKVLANPIRCSNPLSTHTACLLDDFFDTLHLDNIFKIAGRTYSAPLSNRKSTIVVFCLLHTGPY